MAGRRTFWLIAVAAVVLAGALGVLGASAAHPAEADASAVTEWNLVAVKTLTGLPGPAGGAPPAAQIGMGMVQGAVYDAVNAITPKHHRPYLLNRRFGNRASDQAAVATAAYLVLKNIVETVPQSIAFPTTGAVLASLEAQYNASTNAIPDSSFKHQGIAAGTAAAKAMIDAREDDGRFGPSQWVPDNAPGHWAALTTPSGQPILDPTPWVGGVEPFLMQSSSQFRSPGPLALTSKAYADDLNEVKRIGSATASLADRSALQTYVARWWQSTPVVSWNDVARQLIDRNDLDAADGALLLAMQNLAAADAAINGWNDKYHYAFWRPWNAIVRASEDGNAETEPDPNWTALITAPYPDHPSGHLSLDAAHTGVLGMFFDDAPAGGYEITSTATNTGGPATRSFTSFSQALDELVEARIWAGLHYRTADVQGRQLGTNVANYAAVNYFQPVGKD